MPVGPVSAHHLANLSDRPQFQTTLRQLTASGPLELLALLVISWHCGFLGTRVGEASHPGPPDILGAALSEANPHTNQEVPVTINSSSEPTHTILPTSPSIPMPPDPGSLAPTPGSTSPRRPVPHNSAQPLSQNAGLLPQAAGTAQSRLVQTIALSTAVDGPLSQP